MWLPGSRQCLVQLAWLAWKHPTVESDWIEILDPRYPRYAGAVEKSNIGTIGRKFLHKILVKNKNQTTRSSPKESRTKHLQWRFLKIGKLFKQKHLLEFFSNKMDENFSMKRCFLSNSVFSWAQLHQMPDSRSSRLIRTEFSIGKWRS